MSGGLIGIDGQYLIDINSAEFASDELYELKLVDGAGLALPTLEFMFDTGREKLVTEYFNPNKKIKLGIGVDQISEYYDFIVYKTTLDEGQSGAGHYFVHVWAVLDSIHYLDQQRMISYFNEDTLESSSEVFKLVMDRYNWDTKTVTFDDKMVWLQPNTTDRQFLEDVVWHGYYKENDPCLAALRRDKVAIYKPMSKLRDIKGTITDNTNDVTTKVISNSFKLSSNEGILSAWGGSRRIAPIHRLEEGADDEERIDIQKIISGKGVRNQSIKFTESTFIGDNVHQNWTKAYEQNRILRSSLSAIGIEFYLSTYYPIFPLDYYKVDWYNNEENVVKMVAGDWLVTDCVLYITKHRFQQNIKLSRERLIG